MIGPATSVLVLALGAVLAGCGEDAHGPVLAEVGDTRIHAAQLRRFEEHLAESLRPRRLASKADGSIYRP